MRSTILGNSNGPTIINSTNYINPPSLRIRSSVHHRVFPFFPLCFYFSCFALSQQIPISKLNSNVSDCCPKVGMSCQGCVGAVERVLGKMEGVESFDIDIKEQKVTVKGNLQPEAVFQTVSKTGKKAEFWEDSASAPVCTV